MLMQRNREQDEVDVDQIQVDLDQSDDIDEMEKLMRQKMNLAQKQLYQHMDRSGAGEVAGGTAQFNEHHE